MSPPPTPRPPPPPRAQEDYSFYFCGQSVSFELSESLHPPAAGVSRARRRRDARRRRPAPPTEKEEREGIVDAMVYHNTIDTKFPFTRGFYDAVTS